MVVTTWRIDVALLRDGAEAANAAKYWSYRPGKTGKIVWEHKVSELFGVASPVKAAALAGELVVATFTGSPCPDCGREQEGIEVHSRAVATSWQSLRTGVLCADCEEKKAAEAARQLDRVNEWFGTFGGPLPSQLETLSDMLLLDKLTQSAPFKDRHLGGQLLQNAGLSGNDIVRLANMHILVPVATQHPESIKFHDVGAGEYKVSEFRPFQVDWHPAGNGPLGERFEAIGGLASKELHGARTQFPNELEALAKSSIVVEAERYLSYQLSDRGFDAPNEAQLVRFRESVAEAWGDHSLGELYSAIWPGCAKAADGKARTPRMGRDAVTGLAVNSIVKTLSEFRSGQRPAKPYTQPYNLHLNAETVSIFRIVLDLDPMSALEADVAVVLATDAPPLAVPEVVLEGVRHVHSTCRKSMSEDQAFIATMASLELLLPHYDIATINAARAAFAGERLSLRASARDAD